MVKMVSLSDESSWATRVAKGGGGGMGASGRGAGATGAGAEEAAAAAGARDRKVVSLAAVHRAAPAPAAPAAAGVLPVFDPRNPNFTARRVQNDDRYIVTNKHKALLSMVRRKMDAGGLSDKGARAGARERGCCHRAATALTAAARRAAPLEERETLERSGQDVDALVREAEKLKRAQGRAAKGRAKGKAKGKVESKGVGKAEGKAKGKAEGKAKGGGIRDRLGTGAAAHKRAPVLPPSTRVAKPDAPLKLARRLRGEGTSKPALSVKDKLGMVRARDRAATPFRGCEPPAACAPVLR